MPQAPRGSWRWVCLAAAGSLVSCLAQPQTEPEPLASVPANPPAPPPECRQDKDCRPPPFEWTCTPFESFCDAGKCETRSARPVWQDNHGACRTSKDCECQGIFFYGYCMGGDVWCMEGRCVGGCFSGCSNPDGGGSDDECWAGHVCTGWRCEPGCKVPGDCPAGLICDRHTDPRGDWGQCVPPFACGSDAGCPVGTVCGEPAGDGLRRCVPGCRDSSGCATNESCIGGACSLSVRCFRDLDCPRGSICDDGSQSCRPGCRNDDHCRLRQACDHGTCIHSDGCITCPTGEHCVLTAGRDGDLRAVCREGCLSDDECPDDLVCRFYKADWGEFPDSIGRCTFPPPPPPPG